MFCWPHPHFLQIGAQLHHFLRRPVIEFVCQTLYATLADIIVTVWDLLVSDPGILRNRCPHHS